MSNNRSDDNVGYRRPPKHSQFKKGISGNPRGRRRKRPAPIFKNLMMAELFKQITIGDGGKKSKVTKFELIIIDLVNRSIKGDKDARRRVLDFILEHNYDFPEVQAQSEAMAAFRRNLIAEAKRIGGDDFHYSGD
jgi:hypothetical protein